MSSRKFISRRAVLKGAGAALALPFLDSMVPANVVSLTGVLGSPSSPNNITNTGVNLLPTAGRGQFIIQRCFPVRVRPIAVIGVVGRWPFVFRALLGMCRSDR